MKRPASSGVNSYGKGLMQRIHKLQDGSALISPWAKYNPPKSPNYDQIGVKPDFEVKPLCGTGEELPGAPTRPTTPS